MKVFACIAVACTMSLFAQQPTRTEVNVIRGKPVGFSSVSPALQKQLEAKYGKRVAPDSKANGSNAQVTKRGFVYVTPTAERGNK